MSHDLDDKVCENLSLCLILELFEKICKKYLLFINIIVDNVDKRYLQFITKIAEISAFVV